MTCLKLRFLGASQEVGRSCFLLEGSQNILLDAGVKLTEADEEYPLLELSEAGNLDQVVLSHAHLDHSGFLPYLYREGTHASAVMTKPTRDLIQVLLSDYSRLNKSGSAYKEQHIRAMLNRTHLLDYQTESQGVTFYNAGHILGSCVTQIDLDRKRLLYSGDINTRPSRLMEPTHLGYEADALILESTYGAKTDKHPSLKDESNRVVRLMQETLDNGGKVLVPTFAIGRGQEVLFMLENYMRSGLLEKVPIYLDGMVNKALRIYRHNAQYLKREVQLRILTSDDDPFKSEQYVIPQRKDRSDVLEQEKCIILATSGMLNGGPVLQYLRHLAPDEKNLLMLSGFQAKGTRGRELSEGVKELNLDGDLIPINLRVEQAQLSGHSDHEGLLQFARSVRGLKQIFLVHGEPEKSKELSKELERHIKGVQVVLPKLGEEVQL